MEKRNYIKNLASELKTAIANANVPQWAVAFCANIDESTMYIFS